MIKLSLLETEKHDTILLSGKEDMNQKIFELLRRIFDGLTLINLSIITSSSSFLVHTRQGRVFPTPGKIEYHIIYMILH